MAASHNGKYYAKKIRLSDSKGSKTLTELFKPKTPTQTALSEPIVHASSLPIVETKPARSVSPPPSVAEPDTDIAIGRLQGKPKSDRRLFNIYTSKPSDNLSPFTEKGATLGEHPTERLMKHEKSAAHEKATKVQTETRVKVISDKKYIVTLLQNQKTQAETKKRELNRSVIGKLFECLYFITRRKWAQAQYENFVRFVARLGVEQLQTHLEISPTYATYISSTTATKMINILGEYLERKVLSSIQDAPCYALLADESTDESNKTQMAIFCRWQGKGLPTEDASFRDHYIGIIELKKTDSSTLMDSIRIFLNGKGIEIQKCLYTAFDGTNSMSGCRTGLQKRFRHHSPHALYINCRNHRLALCIKHLMKTFPSLIDVDEALLCIWKLFKFSPQRFAVFQEVQAAYGQEKLIVNRAATIRWLSHWKACIRFIDRYEPILDALDALDAIYEARKEPEVAGLRMCVTQKKLVGMICGLCDILKPLNTLSLYLQVKRAVTELQALRDLFLDNPANQPDLYVNKLQDILDIIDDRTLLQLRLRRHVQDLNTQDFLRETLVPLIDGLVVELLDAFHLHPVFDAFRMSFSVSMMPLEGQALELQDHGKGGIDRIADHYSQPGRDVFDGDVSVCPPVVDPPNMKAEYTGFKQQLKILKRSGVHITDMSMKEVFNLLEEDAFLKGAYPELYKLLYMVNCIPASTASVERAFSVLRLIKNKHRNRLTQTTLDSLMKINFEGPEHLSAEDLGSLILLFKNKKDRQIPL
ncbi:uncharacterized protein LOC117341727 [Pecten maximus]|uniref:uncharacterized protein LOC117341727 n=1 Tax=Pecten maximus TaxID=6579 RepID=UPI001458922F|nr:uncharacterized protein LOC117341727 [Pecten maximus]